MTHKQQLQKKNFYNINQRKRKRKNKINGMEFDCGISAIKMGMNEWNSEREREIVSQSIMSHILLGFFVFFCFMLFFQRRRITFMWDGIY